MQSCEIQRHNDLYNYFFLVKYSCDDTRGGAVVLNRDLGFSFRRMLSGTVSSSQLVCLLSKNAQAGAQRPFLFVINGFLGTCHLHSFSVMIFFFFLFSSKSLAKLQNKIIPLRLETTCSMMLFCLQSWFLTYLLTV